MKVLQTCAFCAILLCCFFGQLHAQGALPPGAPDTKPALFSDLPDSVYINTASLDELLALTEQQSGAIRFSGGFALQGKVMSAANSQQPQLRSVVFRSSNRLGAVFTLSRITPPQGAVVYTGRILSRAHADAFELVAAPNGYCLVKRSYQELHEE